MIYISLIVLVLGLVLLIRAKVTQGRTIAQIRAEQQEDLAQREKEWTCAFQERQAQLESQIASLRNQFNAEQEKLDFARSSTERLLRAEHERAAAELDGVRNVELERMKAQWLQKEKELQAQFDFKCAQFNEDFSVLEEVLSDEINAIKLELKEYKSKRDAINEQLRREAELENEQDFHRIILSDIDKDDIHYLLSIENHIHNKEILHKLIYTEYLQKPFNQMLKNILGNRSPRNVIYCIENINTHKKYIGKTAGEYKDRMTAHLKSSLGIGTISHQPIHDALYGHWDEFVFSIIEEVKDNKLSDREHYYISFYESDKYGFNIKS